MVLGSVMSHGLQGIQKGFSQLNHQAEKIVSVAEVDTNDLTSTVEAQVGLIQSSHQIEASVEVVKAADQAIGTLLDLKV